MVVMAPGDANDIGGMLDFALSHDSPTGIRYPKENAVEIARELQPIELGKSERIRGGSDGTILSFGVQLAEAIAAAETLEAEGIHVGVINARFAKPIDRQMIADALNTGFVVTVEEGMLMGGFGSAVLETANEMGFTTNLLTRLGIPDVFMEHGEREELLADLKLDRSGIAQTCRDLAQRSGIEVATDPTGYSA
jgi:1-deoxy-D-xylulose-5-phosphate synthase